MNTKPVFSMLLGVVVMGLSSVASASSFEDSLKDSFKKYVAARPQAQPQGHQPLVCQPKQVKYRFVYNLRLQAQQSKDIVDSTYLCVPFELDSEMSFYRVEQYLFDLLDKENKYGTIAGVTVINQMKVKE